MPPTGIEIAAIVGAVAGVVASAVGGGLAAKTAADQKKALKNAAKDEAEQRRSEARRLIGAQRAGYAKAGVDPTGTPFDVISDTVSQEEIAALRIRQGLRQQARAVGMQGNAAIAGSVGQAGATILSVIPRR